jgi:hypothetical protein
MRKAEEVFIKNVDEINADKLPPNIKIIVCVIFYK